jgi:hypothetical protein
MRFKIEVEPKAVQINYPYFGHLKNLGAEKLVLFTYPNTGTVIFSSDEDEEAGMYFSTWVETAFTQVTTPFTITPYMED